MAASTNPSSKGPTAGNDGAPKTALQHPQDTTGRHGRLLSPKEARGVRQFVALVMAGTPLGCSLALWSVEDDGAIVLFFQAPGIQAYFAVQGWQPAMVQPLVKLKRIIENAGSLVDSVEYATDPRGQRGTTVLTADPQQRRVIADIRREAREISGTLGTWVGEIESPANWQGPIPADARIFVRDLPKPEARG